MSTDKTEYWEGFEFACQLLEDMGYDRGSVHPFLLSDCLRGKAGRLALKKKPRKNPGAEKRYQKLKEFNLIK